TRLAALGRRQQAAVHQALRLAAQAQEHRGARLQRAVAVSLQRHADALSRQAGRLAGLDPRQVLSRGYAWVEDAAGRPLVSSRSLAVGQPLRAVWADGGASVSVTAVDPDPAPARE
ncbi:MAG TPA: exodeoxyribonuclease VII large subunit, partial [Ideonella sp.]|nr:exodeoxyribonuclease VII large subunit [Ideonella sp.]